MAVDACTRMIQAPKPCTEAPKTTAKDADPGPAKTARLNFKVSADFRREFKTYAAQHNKKLNQLLCESFAALKVNHAE